MSKKTGFKIPGVSFSWKRALGITRMKQQFSRKTGIPTSQAGLERKLGRLIMGKGCILPMLLLLGFAVLIPAGVIALLIF
jgi:hypothetical protein